MFNLSLILILKGFVNTGPAVQTVNLERCTKRYSNLNLEQ